MEVSNADNTNKLFHFDMVFPADTTQEDVFKEVKSFIQSAVDGENVCIFAYGQTGAGKTFTMEGPNTDLLYDETEFKVHELSGILPRAADFLFQEIGRL